MHAELRAARAHLGASRLPPGATAQLLPHAVALGLGEVWAARLGQQRPPLPSWFIGGPSMTARGWLSVVGVAEAMAAAPPPGGGAGSASGAADGLGF